VSDKEKSDIGLNVSVPDDVVRSANEFLQRIVNPVAEAADLLSDKLRFIRFRSAIRTLRKAKDISEESGIKLQHVPTKFLVPFLETCSVEDETSELIDRWAALLVSAAQHPRRNFNWCIRILGELNSGQARLLDAIYKVSPSSRPSDLYTQGLASYAFTEELGTLETLTLEELDRFLNRQDGYFFFFNEDDIPNTNEFHLEGFEVGEDLLQLEALGLLWVFASWVFISEKKALLHKSIFDAARVGFC
jgi:hypothetical protein